MKTGMRLERGGSVRQRLSLLLKTNLSVFRTLKNFNGLAFCRLLTPLPLDGFRVRPVVPAKGLRFFIWEPLDKSGLNRVWSGVAPSTLSAGMAAHCTHSKPSQKIPIVCHVNIPPWQTLSDDQATGKVDGLPTTIIYQEQGDMNGGTVVGQCIKYSHELRRANSFCLKRSFSASSIKETFSGCQIPRSCASIKKLLFVVGKHFHSKKTCVMSRFMASYSLHHMKTDRPPAHVVRKTK
jgi:hypothetical protein